MNRLHVGPFSQVPGPHGGSQVEEQSLPWELLMAMVKEGGVLVF